MSPDRPVPPLPWHWRMLESWFRRHYRMEPLHSEPDCLVAFNRFRYQGPPLRLQCGLELRSGDPALELHFRREALEPLIRDGDPRRMGVGLMRLGDRDIPLLARRLESDPALADVRALHALTMFHRGIQRYGFEVLPMERGLAAWWFTTWHRILMARDHAEGWRHVRRQRDKLVTRHIWLSRDELLRRYGTPLPEAPGDEDGQS